MQTDLKGFVQIISLVLVYVTISTLQPTDSVPPLSGAEKEAWTSKINQGFALDAGRSGHRELIPILRGHLQAAVKNPVDTRDTEMALAKLGDKEAQKTLVCQLYTGRKDQMQQVALEELPYVGGWYSIAIYSNLLTAESETRFKKARIRKEDANTPFVGPQWSALISLPKVVPNAPFPSLDIILDNTKKDEFTRLWNEWIQEHESSLRKLAPTGNGIQLDNNCHANIGSSPE